MKHLNIYFVLSTFILLGAACNSDKIEDLEEENTRLKNEMNELNNSVESYLKTIYDIENNLATIKEREQLIDVKSRGGVEFENNARESILNDLKAIDELMKENHAKIAELKEDLYDSGLELSKMHNLIQSMEERLDEKGETISKLYNEIEDLNLTNNALSKEVKTLKYTVDTLEKKTIFYSLVVETQRETIEEKNRKLNNVFYTTGTLKELQEKNVIRKEGGILGIGSVVKLNEKVDNSHFSMLNKQENFTIPINSPKAELVTDHPENSYEFEKESSSDLYKRLVIVDPEEFWKSSRYLVVKVN